MTLFRTVVCKGKKSAEIVVLGPSGANLELSWSGLALLVLSRFGLVQLGRAQLSLFRCWLGAAWTGSVRLGLDRVGPAWLNMVCNVLSNLFPSSSGRWLGGENVCVYCKNMISLRKTSDGDWEGGKM